jgi:hypothetical protein
MADTLTGNFATRARRKELLETLSAAVSLSARRAQMSGTNAAA